MVVSILSLKCQLKSASTTVCIDNKKNGISPHLDTHCSSPSVKKNENNKNNSKIYCWLSRQDFEQDFENNFSVARLVTVLGCGLPRSQNHLFG